MIFRQLFEQVSSTYTYILADENTREAVFIDPVLDKIPQYLQLLNELSLKLCYALDTHVHADHITALGTLREKTQCVTVHGAGSKASCVSRFVEDGEKILFGSHELQAISTPGHTIESFCYYLPKKERGLLFSGDTILIRGTGRTDFQGGDAGQQYDSIHKKLLSLPASTFVYPGHDYKGMTVSTIEEEKTHNPRLQVKDRQKYIKLMSELNLPDPKMMDVAVPANLGCGIDVSSDMD